MKKLNGHTAIVNSMQCSRRGVPYLVSGGDDGTTKLWDLRVRRCVHTFEHQYQILAVPFDDSAERIFSGSLDNTVLVYDMRMRDADPEVLGIAVFVFSVVPRTTLRKICSGSDGRQKMPCWQLGPPTRMLTSGI